MVPLLRLSNQIPLEFFPKDSCCEAFQQNAFSVIKGLHSLSQEDGIEESSDDHQDT